MACTTIASGAIVATSLCGLFYFSDSFPRARLLSLAGMTEHSTRVPARGEGTHRLNPAAPGIPTARRPGL